MPNKHEFCPENRNSKPWVVTSYKARMLSRAATHPEAVTQKRYLRPSLVCMRFLAGGYKMSILRLRLTIISCTESIVFFSRSVSVALV